MSCRCRKIDCASVRGLTAHGYSLIARKPAVGVGATWRFAGTPPSLAASTHARVSGAMVDVMCQGNNQLLVIKNVLDLMRHSFVPSFLDVSYYALGYAIGSALFCGAYM